MDKTRMKLAAFFDQDDEEPVTAQALPLHKPAPPVNANKVSHFTQGSLRKSKKDKEKADEERKAREEEEKAKEVLAEYMDAFEGDGPAAGGSNSTNRKGRGFAGAGSGFVRSGGQAAGGSTVYNPARAGSSPAPPPPPKAPAAMTAFQQEEPTPASVPKKGKRQMDAFLVEIMQDKADREARFNRHGSSSITSATAMAAYEGQVGSKDRGDPETTNLFVSNLPTHVTEQAVGMFFAKHGPVGSVKVMWPRTDASLSGPGADMNASRRTKGSGLSGFVSYMKRRDAETALRELDGFTWSGSQLRVGWSKAVSMPAKPMYVNPSARGSSDEKDDYRHGGLSSRRRSRSRSRDRSRSHSPRRGHSHRSRSRSRSPRRSQHHSRRSRSRSPRRRSHNHDHKRDRGRGLLDDVEEISDEFIRVVSGQVKGNDAAYGYSLFEMEKTNSQFAFLHEKHAKHRYYRSLLDRHHEQLPEFDDDGYNSVYSTDSEEDEEREHGRKTVLSRRARRRFQAMLRALSGRRGELARCMAFALEHAEAAGEVADVLISALLVDGTPVPRKVARLHLICDILHNSAVSLPGAWRFRGEFQSRLGVVFDHLSGIYHSFPGRITAETFKAQIGAVVDIWEDWIVFPPEFTAELRARLEGQAGLAKVEDEEKSSAMPVPVAKEVAHEPSSRFKASSFKPATAIIELELDGEPIDDDVDGVPMEDDVDGMPMEDLDGAPVEGGEDLDGVPMEDLDGASVESLDGAPIGDDVDGAPLENVDGAPVQDLEGEDVGVNATQDDGEPMEMDSDDD